MTYDWLSRKTAMVDPDMGSWEYDYDANGNLTKQRDNSTPRQEIILDYDALNRLTNKTYPEDPRGPGCLVLGFTRSSRPLHVQCTYPPGVAVVTAYEPASDEWIDQRVRKGGR